MKFDEVTYKMYKIKLKFIGLAIIYIVLFSGLSGCSQKEVTLEIVSELLFDNLELLTLSKEFPQTSYELNVAEINILKHSILRGFELSEHTENITPDYFGGGFAVFHITKSNKSGGTLIYDKTDGYMYISKVLVHDKNKREYEKRQSLFNKYLLGVYRFRPSEEIEELLK